MAPRRRADNVVLGIGVTLLAIIIFGVQDAITKLLVADYSPFQLAMVRFWGFAAFINLWSVKLAKVMTGGGEGFGTLSSVFMAAASLGMAVGFGFSE